MNNKLSKPYIAVPLACFCCILWGSAFPAIKTGYQLFGIESGDSASQILFAGIRFAIAGIITLILGSMIARKPLFLKRETVKYAVIVSFLQTSVHYLFFYLGLARSSGSKSSIINSLSVFIIIIISGIFFKDDKLNFQKAAGCIIGIAGIVLVNFDGMDFSVGSGEMQLIISGVVSSLSSIYIKKFSAFENPVTLSGWQFFIGGLTMAAAGICLGGKLGSGGIKGYGILIYLSFLSAVAYTIWGLLLKHNKVSSISVFSFVTPICGVALSALILKEKINVISGISAVVLVSLGIFLVNYKKSEKNAS